MIQNSAKMIKKFFFIFSPVCWVEAKNVNVHLLVAIIQINMLDAYQTNLFLYWLLYLPIEYRMSIYIMWS